MIRTFKHWSVHSLSYVSTLCFMQNITHTHFLSPKLLYDYLNRFQSYSRFFSSHYNCEDMSFCTPHSFESTGDCWGTVLSNNFQWDDKHLGQIMSLSHPKHFVLQYEVQYFWLPADGLKMLRIRTSSTGTNHPQKVSSESK